MRHIYYLIIVLIIITLSIATALLTTNKSDIKSKDVAMTINGRVFSNQEMNKLIHEKPHDLSNSQFTSIIIEKELLIQEAMKQKIHEEAEFKNNIKNFYEQSLISALMNKKNEEFNPSATETEKTKLIDRMDSQIEITTYTYKDFDSAKANTGQIASKNIKIDFSDLSDTLKYYLMEIEPGQTTSPLQDEYGYKRIKLNNIDNTAIKSPINPALNALAEKIIITGKKKALMENWQQEIKNKAVIDIKE